MSNQYLVIKNMRVESANAFSSYITTGISPATFLGFAEAFKFFVNNKKIPARRGQAKTSIDDNVTVSAIIHDYQLQLGRKAINGHLNRTNHKTLTPAETVLSEVLFDAEITLIIKLENELMKAEQLLSQFIKTARFGGGKIANTSELISQKDFEFDNIKSYSELNFDKDLEHGWFISDENEEFDKLSEEIGVLKAIEEYTFTFIDKESDEKRYFRKRKGWNFLNIKGYRFLEKPCEKEGVRFGWEHAFSEPIIGMNELKFFKRVSDIPFWDWLELENGVILTTNKINNK